MTDSNKVATPATDEQIAQLKEPLEVGYESESVENEIKYQFWFVSAKDGGEHPQFNEWCFSYDKEDTAEATVSELNRVIQPLISRIESDRLALAEKEAEIQRLRGLCGEAIEHIMRGRNHGIIRGKLHRASKGVTNE